MAGVLWLSNRNAVHSIQDAAVDSSGDSVWAKPNSGGRKIQLMPETSSALLLGPGATITTKAVRRIVAGGCSIYWMGQSGAKINAVTDARTISDTALLSRQVASVALPGPRSRTARRSMALRFGVEPPTNYSVQQLRGWEGIRVRKHYSATSMDLGIEWRGRHTEGKTDYINGMISSCNSVVYTACAAAARSLGLSTDLGFVHVGRDSFVYDIADHFKAVSSVERVLHHFASRDRSNRMESSFQFANNHSASIIEEVYAGFHTVVDQILEPA